MTAREGASGRVPIALPDPPLRGGGVRLRPPSARDADAVFDACRDPGILRYTRIPRDYDAIDARAFVAGAGARRREGLSLELIITDRPDDALCGAVGLIVDRHDQARAEIGYWVHPVHRGRGLAGAGLDLMARWALGAGGFTRIDLLAAVTNAASLSVVARSPFVREGTARAAWRTPEGREDMAVFSLLAADLAPDGAPRS